MSENNYKPYTAKRWTDIPEPVVTGHTEFTEEQKQQNHKELERMMQKYGVIKSNTPLSQQ